jgi:hypothetical protein
MGTAIRALFDWDAGERATWAARVAGHRLLEDVVDDGLDIVDVVVQDEYTHDIIVPVAPSLWLVYDAT